MCRINTRIRRIEPESRVLNAQCYFVAIFPEYLWYASGGKHLAFVIRGNGHSDETIAEGGGSGHRRHLEKRPTLSRVDVLPFCKRTSSINFATVLSGRAYINRYSAANKVPLKGISPQFERAKTNSAAQRCLPFNAGAFSRWKFPFLRCQAPLTPGPEVEERAETLH